MGGVLAAWVVVLAHCVETAGLDLPPHPCPAHPGLPLCWASVTPNTGIVVGLLENRPGSVLVENMLGSALLEKMLGPWVELENISGTAVGSGPGLSMVVVLNRSSNSFRAEYRSEADMVCSLIAGGTLTSPALGFLFIGGRVVVGGLARGSEMLGLVTQGVTLLTGLALRLR